MKYKTLTFDANRPIPQQITEPLNSDYGVAVKVYKDGQLVDADLSVDGVACVEGFDGWKLCELTTNREEGTKKINVAVEKQPTVYAELNTTKTKTGGSPVPSLLTKALNVIVFAQDMPELVGKTIYFKDFSFDLAATVTDARGTTTYPDFGFPDIIIYATNTDFYYVTGDGFFRDEAYYQSLTLGEESKFVARTKV